MQEEVSSPLAHTGTTECLKEVEKDVCLVLEFVHHPWDMKMNVVVKVWPVLELTSVCVFLPIN